MSAAAAWVLAGALWLGCLAVGVAPGDGVLALLSRWAGGRPGWVVALPGLGLLALAALPRREGLRLVVAAAGLGLLGAGIAGGRVELAADARLARLAAEGGAAEIVGAVVTEPRESRHGAWAILRVERLGGVAVRERAAIRLTSGPPGASPGGAGSPPGAAGSSPGIAGAHRRSEGLPPGAAGLPALPDLGVRLRARVTARPLEGEGFDGHLRRLHAVALLTPVSPPTLERPAGALWRMTSALRTRTREIAHGALDADRAALLTGLLTGDVRGQTPERKDVLAAAGLTHLVVVSGRHVGLLLAGVLGLAAAAGLGARGRRLLGLAAMAFYVLLVRWEPSVLRAAVMATLVLGAGLAGRRADARHSLAMAVVLLLLVDPLLAGHLGFGLSVGATAGVLVVTPWLVPCLPGPRPVRVAAAVTIGAQAGAAPLLLSLDSGLSAASVPANVLAVPLAGAAQLVGILAVPVGLLWSSAGSAIAVLAGPPLSALLAVAEWAAGGPTLSVGLLASPVALMAAGAVVALTAGRRARPLAAGFATLGMVLFAVGLRPPAGIAELTITMIDVGQGDAVLVEAPAEDGRTARLLVDAGPEPAPLLEALRARRVAALDAVVLTHPHQDHAGGLAEVLERIPVGALLTGPSRPEGLAHQVEAAAARQGVHVRRVGAGDTLTLGRSVAHVLWPPPQGAADPDPNESSVVLHIESEHGSALLTGDAEEDSQRRLLARPEQLRADVLKVPHHGGDTNADGFLAAVGASDALIGVGQDNPYGHPARAVLSELAGMRVHRTDRDGTVTLAVTAEGVVRRRRRPARRRHLCGRRDPCPWRQRAERRRPAGAPHLPPIMRPCRDPPCTC